MGGASILYSSFLFLFVLRNMTFYRYSLHRLQQQPIFVREALIRY